MSNKKLKSRCFICKKHFYENTIQVPWTSDGGKFKGFVHKYCYHSNTMGSPGFTQLMYNGVPVVQKDYVPTGEVWLTDDDGKVIQKIKVDLETDA